MRRLTSKEWVGVAVAVGVVAVVLMGNMISGLFSTSGNKDMEEGQTQEQSIPAENGTYVTAHYTLRLKDGRVVESSKNTGRPFTFVMGAGQVIKGWETGLQGAKKGETRTLEIPPAEAYGSVAGHPLQNETLIFDIEIVDVKKAQ